MYIIYVNNTLPLAHEISGHFWAAYVHTTELYYSLEERLLYFLQSTECPQKHGGFWRHWRHYHDYWFRRLMVITTDQAQFWSRLTFHTPLVLFTNKFCVFSFCWFCSKFLLFLIFSTYFGLWLFCWRHESCFLCFLRLLKPVKVFKTSKDAFGIQGVLKQSSNSLE